MPPVVTVTEHGREAARRTRTAGQGLATSRSKQTGGTSRTSLFETKARTRHSGTEQLCIAVHLACDQIFICTASYYLETIHCSPRRYPRYHAGTPPSASPSSNRFRRFEQLCSSQQLRARICTMLTSTSPLFAVLLALKLASCQVCHAPLLPAPPPQPAAIATARNSSAGPGTTDKAR